MGALEGGTEAKKVRSAIHHKGQRNEKVKSIRDHAVIKFFSKRRMSTYVRSSRVHRRSKRVSEQIRLPAQELHEDDTKEGVDRCLFEDLVVI